MKKVRNSRCMGPHKLGPESLRVRDLFVLFFAKGCKGFSPRTTEIYHHNLSRLLKTFGGKPAVELSEPVVMEWLSSQEYSDNYGYMVGCRVRRFLKWCRDNKMMKGGVA